MLKSYDSRIRLRFSEILKRILEICDPRKLTRDKLSSLASTESMDRDEDKQITLFAVGKASLFMALGAKDFLRTEGITGGIIVAPRAALSTGTGQKAAAELEAFGLEVMGTEHPYPGEGSFLAGKAVLETVRNCKGRCLFLLSGGASSLMELNHEKFPRNEVFAINKALVTSGANIAEINTVRKHISAIKGGRLAQEFSGTSMVNLIISDVTGSALETIGSGPTYRDSYDSTFKRCRDILQRYDILKLLSIEGRDFFNTGDPEYESPKELLNDDKLEYHILLSNEVLVEIISREYNYELFLPATEIVPGFSPDRLTAASLATHLLDLCRRTLSAKPNSVCSVEKSSKFVIGGEPTVRVMGKGTGGRAQHTALLFLVGLMTDETLWERRNDITLVTFATDGMDGNSPGAGVIVDGVLFDKLISSFNESGAYCQWCEVRQNVEIRSLTMFVESGPVGILPRAQLCRRYNGAKREPVDFWRKSKAQGNLRLTGVQREPERTDSAESVRAKMLGAVNEYLDKFDSYGFFEKYDSSIITGPTGTNVLDVYLLEIA